MMKAKYLLMLSLAATLQAHAQGLNGVWKGELQAGPQKLTVLLHIDSTAKTVGMDVVEQGASNLPMEVHLLSHDSIHVSIPKMMLNYTGKLSDGHLKGQFKQQLFATTLDFEPGEVTFNRPQEPQPPYPYTTEEVSFENPQAHVTLAGTLTYPTNYKKGKRVPVVLMVTGSGPENRDEEIFHHKPFLVLADWLARHGIASLRYDDRGVGSSTGQFNGATTADFADDAQAGVKFLRARKQFSRVGILGHSEGGAIGYILGSRRIPDFIVSLSGPACKIDTLMMAQLNLIGRSQGATTDMVDSPAAARKLLLSSNPDDKWMNYFLDMDLTTYVRNTRCPVLALGGEKDLNVPAEMNIQALKANLPVNRKNKIKVYEGLSHLFHHSPTGNPLLAVNIEETIAPEVLEDIVEWILGKGVKGEVKGR